MNRTLILTKYEKIILWIKILSSILWQSCLQHWGSDAHIEDFINYSLYYEVGFLVLFFVYTLYKKRWVKITP